MAAPDEAALASSICHDLAISEDEAQPSPPWGALPAEQYLIRNWDWTSPLPAADQTRALVRAFLSLDDIPVEWDATPRTGRSTISRIPTPSDIRTILLPWRPLRYRDAAYHLWSTRSDEAIWLRTYYGGGEEADEKFAAWRAMDEDYDPNFDEECRPWTVLDDRERFDFADDEWWRVFDLLPELAGPNQKHSRRPAWGNEGRVREMREGLRRDVEERRRRLASSGGEGVVTPEEAAVLEAEYGVHGQELQEAAVATFLLVADARAFETDCLRVLFLDAKGNVVRHTTTDVSDAWEMRGYWVNFRFNESPWWMYEHDLVSGLRTEGGAELGEKYRARGELGRALYGLEL